MEEMPENKTNVATNKEIATKSAKDVFQQMFTADIEREGERKKIRKTLMRVIIGAAAILTITLIFFITTLVGLKNTYVSHERETILAMGMANSANDWERLPEGEQREKLLNRYFEIVKYYNVYTPDNNKMVHKTILDSFKVLYECTEMTKTNIFLPIAYIKVMTNFNPNYESGNRFGIAAFYVKEGENISNLPVVKEKSEFNVYYKGIPTLKNPIESIKLLIAKIDDLNKIFNNRSDWVIFALLTNEYEVIDKYWINGEGLIPEDQLRQGNLKEIRDYYYIFNNWKIIPQDDIYFPIPTEVPNPEVLDN